MTKLFALGITLLINSAVSAQNFLIRSQLTLDDGKKFVSLQYGRKESGCGFINSRGVLEKEIPLERPAFGAARLGKDIVFFILSLKK